MKPSNDCLRQFGAILNDVRQEMNITTDLLAAEIGASKRLFNEV